MTKLCAKYVETCFDKATGGFRDAGASGKPDVFSTAVGIMAVVELKLPTEPYRAGVVKDLGENAKSFEDIRIAVAGLEAIGKRPPQAEAWLEQIGKMRHADGTYGKGAGACAGHGCRRGRGAAPGRQGGASRERAQGAQGRSARRWRLRQGRQRGVRPGNQLSRAAPW